jgi:predicted naringenin-chalcone synthase
VVDEASLVVPAPEVMTWRIGDHGFRMTLAPQVPALVREHLPGFLVPWLAGHGLAIGDVGGWAIHPGGPRILTAALAALELPEAAGEASRGVLADYGNMSSPTVLFILEALRAAGQARPWVVLAFGPGLTIEAALLR